MDFYLYEKYVPEPALLCRGNYMYSHREVFMYFFVLFLNCAKGFKQKFWMVS